MPSVSVLMPVYNSARYLQAALDSMFTQTHRDFELIAVDDGSTDSSLAILKTNAARDSRLRIISRPNTGIVGALNDALSLATGEFIARMDADDISLPARLEKQLSHLRARPSHVCIGSHFIYIDEHDAPLQFCPRETDPAKIETALLSGDGGALIHPSILIRKTALDRTGPYREPALWVEDLDLYLRLARIGALSNVPEVLLHYRFHAQSVNFTRNQGRHARKLWALTDAHTARGLTFNPGDHPLPPLRTGFTAADACLFAATSLQFPNLNTPWRYALKALRLAPTKRETWRTLNYLIKISIGIIPRPPAYKP